ncbi:hypothetical protein; putative exported protein [Xenorhabdus nematophila ATCC 19061]|uniref:Uncharacterized protein n=1 Tax=Xenorhabdus nematophila (strain ATCC 19061 / DSM 3370 / CCUG 14189 / LMG 1036 / NCIMB 9965 / AN6) TaxID=406817 RepID=D3VC58_XENNA|nr:hypothetical protein [Xenorhabdus nematophila]CBJ89711.1 hypothetical protein; putative exported protein [Xenorhabdus nematophila ATCC 19061]CEK22592.1 hypothetical protein; putative exported protein [Xenorhabdus nematophila AN6/1]
MKIKGSFCLFFILSVCFSQVMALDFSYKSDIPADNKPSEEYLKKRTQLGHENWRTEKLAADNALAEKRENELKKYHSRDDKTTISLSLSSHDWDKKTFKTYSDLNETHSILSYDWNEKKLTTYPYDPNKTHFMQHFNEHTKRRCYRETRQKLEKEQGNGYSNADISDACGSY